MFKWQKNNSFSFAFATYSPSVMLLLIYTIYITNRVWTAARRPEYLEYLSFNLVYFEETP